ncbi:zf-HC2 domain-containing protein [Streptomyces sp. NPDC057494]|uniref:zf-HC2 domain-containing protein n=1 Tax=Streptomyces sp. NPDC057494 TaxID=3346148 RepID=UPI0036C2CF1A
MTAPWHVSGTLARRYAAGTAPETDAWSLEKHVESCAPCAALVSAAVRASTAGPALAAVRADLLTSLGHAPARTATTRTRAEPGGVIRPRGIHAEADVPGTRPDADVTRPYADAAGARVEAGVAGARVEADVAGARPDADAAGARVEAGLTGTRRGTGVADTRPEAVSGASPGPSVAGGPVGRWVRVGWAAGPALRGSWVVAVVLVVGGAFALAHGAGLRGARSWLLAVSPLLPLAGVAVSYGRHADPLHEITAATPSGGLRLLLTRTAAVLAVCVPLLTAGGALLPPVAGFPGAAAWLLPGLALTLAALALGSFVGCRAAAATLGGGWLLAVAGPLLGPQGQGAAGVARYFAGPAVQGAWATAALVCAALLALRRRSFDHLETNR